MDTMREVLGEELTDQEELDSWLQSHCSTSEDGAPGLFVLGNMTGSGPIQAIIEDDNEELSPVTAVSSTGSAASIASITAAETRTAELQEQVMLLLSTNDEQRKGGHSSFRLQCPPRRLR